MCILYSRIAFVSSLDLIASALDDHNLPAFHPPVPLPLLPNLPISFLTPIFSPLNDNSRASPSLSILSPRLSTTTAVPLNSILSPTFLLPSSSMKSCFSTTAHFFSIPWANGASSLGNYCLLIPPLPRPLFSVTSLITEDFLGSPKLRTPPLLHPHTIPFTNMGDEDVSLDVEEFDWQSFGVEQSLYGRLFGWSRI